MVAFSRLTLRELAHASASCSVQGRLCRERSLGGVLLVTVVLCLDLGGGAVVQG